MTRISLKEAYDNKDVAVQIFNLKDTVEKHSEILDNLPNPDLTNCVLKTGDQTIDGEKTFNDVIKAVGGLDLDNMGPLTVNGDLEVNGDIIQNGSAYETHAEQVFSANDYIVTRDGAVGSLPAGSYSGIQVKKYNGVDDCRLVVDNRGTARVGDINDEQPLTTRNEDANMASGAIVKWDGTNKRIFTDPNAIAGKWDKQTVSGTAPFHVKIAENLEICFGIATITGVSSNTTKTQTVTLPFSAKDTDNMFITVSQKVTTGSPNWGDLVIATKTTAVNTFDIIIRLQTTATVTGATYQVAWFALVKTS